MRCLPPEVGRQTVIHKVEEVGDPLMDTEHMWTEGAVTPAPSAYVLMLPIVGRVNGTALPFAGSKARMQRTSFDPSPSGSSAPTSTG